MHIHCHPAHPQLLLSEASFKDAVAVAMGMAWAHRSPALLPTVWHPVGLASSVIGASSRCSHPRMGSHTGFCRAPSRSLAEFKEGEVKAIHLGAQRHGVYNLKRLLQHKVVL